MKTISTTLDAHLRQEVTTICTCWRVIRQDGQVFGFTDHDQDIVYGGLTYESESGYNRTAITGDASYSVDNANVTGFLESDKISENDLRNGLFDFAKVFVFGVNWTDLTQGAIALRRGWLGEVIINANGSFETELRGLHQALSFNFMESYQMECRADFCDDRCTLKIANYTYAASVFAATSQSVFQGTSIPVVATTGSTTVGAHRYWRVKITGTYSTQYVGIAEVALFDQANAPISGGTATASSTRAMSGGFLGIGGTTYHADAARDGNASSGWECVENSAVGSWWMIDFGSGNAKDVKSITMTSLTDDYRNTPQGFNLEYSDNGLDWTTAKACATHWSGPAQNETWTLGTSLPDPVDYSATLGALPPPFTGASTYVGGTITFTSGLNNGNTIEIVGYDAASNTITMFEAFPYPISPGDHFNIAQGCDKMFATCKVYGNQLNFRGEPHVPGQDAYLSYPDATP